MTVLGREITIDVKQCQIVTRLFRGVSKRGKLIRNGLTISCLAGLRACVKRQIVGQKVNG
jgi:hypothetical protein